MIKRIKFLKTEDAEPQPRRRFANALGRLRTEVGFPTPYAFYHRNGGRRLFPFTYAYYLKVERGKSLPPAKWLSVILAALRIVPTEERHRNLLTNYLRDACEDENAFQELFGTLLCRHQQDRPEKQAPKRLMTEQAHHLSIEQYKTITASQEACWTFECLCNDREGFTPGEIARIIGLPERRIQAALRTLEAVRLVEKRRDGQRYRSPLSGKFYVVPRKNGLIRENEKRLLHYGDKMAEMRGAELLRHGLLLRAEESEIRKAMLLFAEAMEVANGYAVLEKGEATGLYFMSASVRRMFWL